MQGGYSYSNEPQVAPYKSSKVSKGKYREESDAGRSNSSNLMHDPRVFRGSNVANKLMSNSLQDKKIVRDVPRGDRRRISHHGGMRSSTPPAVHGRSHMDMQTDEYLEVLSDRPEETEMATQTLAELDRPSSPLFVRAKTGVDTDTQIMPGDLFDFDLEVEPLLEVLVGRTVHVAMLEVMQEEELEAIMRAQTEFLSVRNVELAEVQRLEADARRKTQEKQRRVQQEQERLEEQRKLESKVAARAFAQQFLATLHEDVFAVLEEEGRFVDPLEAEVEEIFMPALMAGLRAQYSVYQEASNSLTQLIMEANALAEREAEVAIRVRDEEEEEALRVRQALEEEARALLLATATVMPMTDGGDEEGGEQTAEE